MSRIFQVKGGTNYYTMLEEHKGGFVSLAPVGGGFITHHAREHLIEVNLPTDMLVGYARIEDGEEYPCVCNPHMPWNGWAQPAFTKEVFEQIAGGTDPDIVLPWKRVEDDKTYLYGYYIFNETLYMDEKDAEVCVILDNKTGLYTFDGWCWDFISAEDKLKADNEQWEHNFHIRYYPVSIENKVFEHPIHQSFYELLDDDGDLSLAQALRPIANGPVVDLPTFIQCGLGDWYWVEEAQ